MESNLLNIDIYNRFENQLTKPDSFKRLFGLVKKYNDNRWFSKPSNFYSNEPICWHDLNNTTKIVQIEQGHYQLRQIIQPEFVKCSRIGLLVFDVDSESGKGKLLHSDSSTVEICPDMCDNLDTEVIRKVGKKI